MTAPAVVQDVLAPIDRLTGATRALRREKTLRAQIFHPPPRYSVSEWADRHRYLSRLASAEEGRWRTSRAPYQRGIMDTISDPTVQRVCWMAPSQCGKSEALLCTIGYFIDQDPAPMLMVQPSIESARDFSEDRIKTMIDASPRLRVKVQQPSGRREAGNKMLRKAFPGGHLTLVGANSATGLASRPIRVVLFDEVDKYPPSAGDKGDPIALASNRTKTFWNRKIVIVTTPGVKGASRIEKEWAESDQRRYFVPCPHCGHMQHLQWARVVFDDATYCCESCAGTIEDRQKASMLAKGEWIATNPEGTFPGFHLNALYSPWTTWKEMVAKFLVAKKAPDTLRVFVNEDLAELWDPNDGDAFDTDTLKSRREIYPAEVPNDVGVLTAFVDVQRDWLELTVRGWCAGQRSYLIAHHRIQGDPGLPHVWDRLDVYRTKAYQHESGATLKIAALGVDSGDGQTVQHVYRFVAPRQKQGVYATKGLSIRGRPISNRPAKRNKYGVRVFPVGTEAAKDLLFQRLKIVKTPDAEAPPGYLHFPPPLPDGGCDDEYLDQFGREQVFIRHVHGVPIREYHTVPKGARNEAVDLEVGCIAMLHLLGAAVYDQLSVWAGKVQSEGAKLRAAGVVLTGAPDTVSQSPAATPSIIPPVRPQRPRPGGGGFKIGGWKNKW